MPMPSSVLGRGVGSLVRQFFGPNRAAYCSDVGQRQCIRCSDSCGRKCERPEPVVSGVTPAHRGVLHQGRAGALACAARLLEAAPTRGYWTRTATRPTIKVLGGDDFARELRALLQTAFERAAR